MFVLTLNLVSVLLGPATVMGASAEPACGYDVYETSNDLAPRLLKTGHVVHARVCRSDSDVYGLGLEEGGDSVTIRLESDLPDGLSPSLIGPDSTKLEWKRIRTAAGWELRFTVAKSGVHRYGSRATSRAQLSTPLRHSWVHRNDRMRSRGG